MLNSVESLTEIIGKEIQSTGLFSEVLSIHSGESVATFTEKNQDISLVMQAVFLDLFFINLGYPKNISVVSP